MLVLLFGMVNRWNKDPCETNSDLIELANAEK